MNVKKVFSLCLVFALYNLSIQRSVAFSEENDVTIPIRTESSASLHHNLEGLTTRKIMEINEITLNIEREFCSMLKTNEANIPGMSCHSCFNTTMQGTDQGFYLEMIAILQESATLACSLPVCTSSRLLRCLAHDDGNSELAEYTKDLIYDIAMATGQKLAFGGQSWSRCLNFETTAVRFCHAMRAFKTVMAHHDYRAFYL